MGATSVSEEEYPVFQHRFCIIGTEKPVLGITQGVEVFDDHLVARESLSQPNLPIIFSTVRNLPHPDSGGQTRDIVRLAFGSLGISAWFAFL